MGWLSRLFGGSDDAPAAAPAAAPRPVAASAPAPAPAESSGATTALVVDVDNLYYRWIVGSGVKKTDPSVAKFIMDELVRTARSPSGGSELVPRVPAVIPKLLKTLRDEGTSGGDVAKLIAQDVVLVAEVIREANSPYYHPTAPVKTIDGAIMLLGQNGLRMLLARVSFRPIISMQSGQFAKRVAPQVWAHSEKCAMAANLLAPSCEAEPFEAYLAGLMHDVGMIVAFRVIDQVYHDDVLPQSDAFCKGLVMGARIISARIAAVWDFPESVVEAINTVSDLRAGPLAQTLALADRLAKLRMLVDSGQLEEDDPYVVIGLDRAMTRVFEKIKSEE